MDALLIALLFFIFFAWVYFSAKTISLFQKITGIDFLFVGYWTEMGLMLLHVFFWPLILVFLKSFKHNEKH